jgi:mRNA-degrading endonuclease toxin of MazEF toxin-antitoxin module
LVKDSVIQCNLIRCVSEVRILQNLGQLTPATMEKVDNALRISLSL